MAATTTRRLHRSMPRPPHHRHRRRSEKDRAATRDMHSEATLPRAPSGHVRGASRLCSGRWAQDDTPRLNQEATTMTRGVTMSGAVLSV